MRRGRALRRLALALAGGAWLAFPTPAAAQQPAAGAIESLWARGETAFEAGDLAAALRLFSEALTLDERRARSWNYLGGVHFAQGDLPRALQDFRRALELDPNDVRAANNAGTALERLGDLQGAAEAYATAARIAPAYALTHRNLGVLRARLGDAEGARLSWRRYLELAPAGPHAEEVRRAIAALDAPAAGAPEPAAR